MAEFYKQGQKLSPRLRAQCWLAREAILGEGKENRHQQLVLSG